MFDKFFLGIAIKQQCMAVYETYSFRKKNYMLIKYS